MRRLLAVLLVFGLIGSEAAPQQASAEAIAFQDGFEAGFGGWTTVHGTPTASSLRVHNGKSSYILDQDQDVIQRLASTARGDAVEVWFYDDASNSNMSAYAFVDANTSAAVALGVNTSVSGNEYVVRLGANSSASGVARTTGWHSFVFDYRSGSKVVLYIDGKQVADSNSVTAYKRVALGDYWSDGKISGAYFDDIRISDKLPWEPYTVPAPAASSALPVAEPGGVVFYDDFEYGLGRWTTLYGTADASTAQAASGTSSYAVNEDQDAIQHKLAAMQSKVAVINFYDDAADQELAVMAYADAYDSALTIAGLGVNTDISVTHYVYRFGTSDGATSIQRAAGWHSLVFDYRSAQQVSLYIDGVPVGQFAGDEGLSRVAFGDFWQDAKTGHVYFDDVRIQDHLPWEQPAYPQGLSFQESFDDGLDGWTTLHGSPTVSADRARDGERSYKVDQAQDAIQHAFQAPLNQAAVIWFYDDADREMNVMAFADSGTVPVGIGVNSAEASAHYVHRIGSVTTSSGIPRSTGWHSLVFDYRSGSGVVLYIDGAEIASSTAATALQRIALGDWWSGGPVADVYFDRLSVQDSLPWDAPFADGLTAENFDAGFANWTALSGTPTVTTARAHNDLYSFVLSQDEQTIGHNFGMNFNQVAEIWFYDEAGRDSLRTMVRVDRLLTEIGLGVDAAVSDSHYVYQIGSAVTASPIERTTGWHSLAFDYRSGTGVALYIDGKLIAESAAESAFNRIVLGDFWKDGHVAGIMYDQLRIGGEVPQEPGMIFKDGFEHGFDRWVSVSGTPLASANQAYEGTYSYALDEDLDVIQHQLAARSNDVAVIRFYDDTSVARTNALAYADRNSTVIGLGVSTPVSASHYVYRVGGTTYASSVSRTTGWHSLVFDYRSGTGVTMYIDGVEVYSSTGATYMTRIALGDYWTGYTSAVYFDDVRVQTKLPWETDPVPEPVVTSDTFGFEDIGAWRSEAYLLEDNPGWKDSNLLATRTTTLEQLATGGVTASSVHVKEGQSAGKWANHPYYPTISTRSFEQDWSASNSVSFWIYAEAATQENVSLILHSDHPSTSWREFYSYTFPIDFAGWKQIEIPFRSFTASGETAGWHRIEQMSFSAKAFNKEPSPHTVLYLDDIQLHDRGVNELAALTSLTEAEPSMLVSYAVAYPDGFEAMPLTAYLRYVNNKLEYETASPSRRQEIEQEQAALLTAHGLGSDTYALSQFVETRPRIAAQHDIVPMEAHQLNHGAAEIREQPSGPVVHEPYWKTERAVYGYYPQFMPGPVSFAPGGSRYVRYGNSVIQVYDQENQRWYQHDLEPVFERYAAQQLGWYGYKHRDDNFYQDVNIRFDSDGDAYMTATIQQVNADGTTGVLRSLLLHSADQLKTWKAYPLTGSFAKLEALDTHNTDALSRPPVITLHDYWTSKNKSGYFVIPQKLPSGELYIPPRTKVCESCLTMGPTHSGDTNVAVTVTDSVYFIYSVMELEKAPAIPANHPATALTWTAGNQLRESRKGLPAYVVSYDIPTGQLSEPVFVGYGGRANDDHNWPAIAVDSQGYLHAFVNGHHDPVYYTRSSLPRNISEWNAPELIGQANSYASVVVDQDDTLYLVTRNSQRGYNFDMTLYRKPAGQAWAASVNLAERFKSYYEVWNQKLKVDPDSGDLYLTYYSQSRQSQMFKDEYDAYMFVWPDREQLKNPSGTLTPMGTYQTQGRKYTTFSGMVPTGMSTLISRDSGLTWRLLTTADFQSP
ncbi:Carbohydrate binding domain (family 11) [Paenibacillus sp. UNCCL117]|nr:Carbohydrate binding domain (family 11) [Paenibacillus sp. cl123]SFW16937.1 Carbohydrate binding domain (family 11) [Paenibacillus sp. UNCCL117]